MPRHEEVEALLRKYPEKIGLGVIQPNNEVNQFLTMTLTEQRRMTSEECGEAAVVINQAAVYIQLEMNAIEADIRWCRQAINYMIAGAVSNVGGQYTPYRYKHILAIKQNDVAMQLQRVATQAKLRLDAMRDIPQRLWSLSTAFSQLQQTKRHQK